MDGWMDSCVCVCVRAVSLPTKCQPRLPATHQPCCQLSASPIDPPPGVRLPMQLLISSAASCLPAPLPPPPVSACPCRRRRRCRMHRTLNAAIVGSSGSATSVAAGASAPGKRSCA
eukprot:359003-Chlamydomonas_euryale.AAC.1